MERSHIIEYIETMESKKYSLNKEDLIKVSTGALLAIIGALLTYLTGIIGQIDFGVWTPVATAIFAIVANIVRKYISGYQN